MADHDAHGHAAEDDARGSHEHPTWKQYKWVALILTLITVVEVWLYYIPAFVGRGMLRQSTGDSRQAALRSRDTPTDDWAFARPAEALLTS